MASTSGSGTGKQQTSANGRVKPTKRRKSSSDDDDDAATDLSGDNASSTDAEVTHEPPTVPKRLRTQPQRSAKQKLLSKMSAHGRGRGWSSSQ